jgi:hypothetical protein
MLVREAKDVARQWVEDQAASLPGFRGAYLAGSINWIPDDADLARTSDVDVMVVLDDVADPSAKPGKLLHRGIILDVTHLSAERFHQAEEILSDFQLASGFRVPSVIADPSGHLTRLQTEVSREFARREWVRKRCENARKHALRYLGALHQPRPAWPTPRPEVPQFHDQVTVWLFGTSMTTQVLLLAGLRNPTVRRRYVDVRELLAEYGHSDFYETLLDMLGCADLSQERTRQHLVALAEAFDAAKTVIKTPFFFASDISDAARPIAIDGSRELIEQGLHREAVFWIVATYSRCQGVFFRDAPEAHARFDPSYRELLAGLGIASLSDLERRTRQVEELLPAVWDVAEAIMAANPAIED